MEGQDEEILAYVRDYLGLERNDQILWGILRAGMSSVADTFIAQIQDYLELGAESRMNEPGLLSTKNWSWRLQPGQLTEELAKKIRHLAELYERV